MLNAGFTLNIFHQQGQQCTITLIKIALSVREWEKLHCQNTCINQNISEQNYAVCEGKCMLL